MKHVVGLSGGKDSTAMAVRLKELNPGIEYEYVLTPTGDELPETEEHWKLLELILGPLKRLPTLDLFELIEREGMIPNWRARFCTRVLKVEPFIDYMKSLPEGSVLYVGLRADEEDRTGIQGAGIHSVYPMQDWEWDLEKVMGYLNQCGIRIPERTDCGCCFWQRLYEWYDLWVYYPDRYDKYVQVEKKHGHTFRSPSRDTWPAALDDLRQEFINGRKPIRKKIDKNKRCRFCSM